MQMQNNIRKFIVPVLILVIAAGFSWWSARAESRVVAHIQEEVTKLVPLLQNNPEFLDTFVTNAVLAPTLVHSLEAVSLQSSKHGGAFDVLVTQGDNGEHGDGSATHVAVFQINNEQIAGLRIICATESDPLLITGVWIQ
jgi:hypothetical protein